MKHRLRLGSLFSGYGGLDLACEEVFDARTALVADVLGRDGISVDLSQDYCRLAEWRTTDPKQRAKAARVETAEPVPDDQLSLFEGQQEASNE